MSWRWVPDKARRRRLHGKLVKLSADGRTILRVLRFSTRLGGTPRSGEGQIVLDWPGWLELNDFDEDADGSIQVTVRNARWYEQWKIVFSHPDPTYRIAGQLGAVSVVLGIVSLIIAFFA